MMLAYYPGCSLEGTASEYDMSTRAVARMLGVELKELEDWNCCGASSAHCLDHELSVELPVFDQHQAGISKAESNLRRARRDYAALAIGIRSEVRAARDRMTAARDMAEHYRDVVVPLQERLVALTQRQYNFMQTGAFDLLLAKQNEIRTYRDYINAVRDYWLARTDLEMAVGGSLAGAAQMSQSDPPNAGQERRN